MSSWLMLFVWSVYFLYLKWFFIRDGVGFVLAPIVVVINCLLPLLVVAVFVLLPLPWFVRWPRPEL